MQISTMTVMPRRSTQSITSADTITGRCVGEMLPWTRGGNVKSEPSCLEVLNLGAIDIQLGGWNMRPSKQIHDLRGKRSYGKVR